MTKFRLYMTVILTPSERKKIGLLLCCMFVMAILEMAGIAAVLPFMMILSDPSVIQRNDYLFAAYQALSFSDTKNFLTFLGILIFLQIILANSFKAFTTYMIIRFSNEFNHDLSLRLLHQYMRRSYGWYLQKNSSNLAKTLLAEVNNVTKQIIMPCLQTISQLILLIIIVLLLLNVNATLTALSFLIFGSLYGGLYALIRGRLSKLGVQRLATNRQRFKVTHESLYGIKDIRILGVESFFSNRYEQSSKEFIKTDIQNQVFGQIPRFILEALGFGGILLLTLYLYSHGNGLADVLPTLSVFAFAAYKLMPAFQIIYQNISNMSFGLPILDHIVEDLTPTSDDISIPHELSKLPFNDSIVFKNVSYCYPQSHRPSVENVNLDIKAHSTIALVGETGSGKSTILDILIGLLLPQSGTLSVDGHILDEKNIAAWRKNIGYVPQHIFLTNDSVLQNIAFGIPVESIDRDRVIQAAKTANIHDFIMEKLPQQYETEIGERGIRLSGGERQRLGIARALYYNPDVLLFDEATSALDNITEKTVIEAIQSLSREKTIILIAHRLSTVRQCDRIYLLQSGRIEAYGRYEELEQRSSLFKTMLDAERKRHA